MACSSMNDSIYLYVCVLVCVCVCSHVRMCKHTHTYTCTHTQQLHVYHVIKFNFANIRRLVGGGRGDWMELAQDRDRWWALVSTVKNFQVP
jgi:hypothetical protein